MAKTPSKRKADAAVSFNEEEGKVDVEDDIEDEDDDEEEDFNDDDDDGDVSGDDMDADGAETPAGPSTRMTPGSSGGSGMRPVARLRTFSSPLHRH